MLGNVSITVEEIDEKNFRGWKGMLAEKLSRSRAASPGRRRSLSFLKGME